MHQIHIYKTKEFEPLPGCATIFIRNLRNEKWFEDPFFAGVTYCFHYCSGGNIARQIILIIHSFF